MFAEMSAQIRLFLAPFLNRSQTCQCFNCKIFCYSALFAPARPTFFVHGLEPEHCVLAPAPYNTGLCSPSSPGGTDRSALLLGREGLVLCGAVLENGGNCSVYLTAGLNALEYIRVLSVGLDYSRRFHHGSVPQRGQVPGSGSRVPGEERTLGVGVSRVPGCSAPHPQFYKWNSRSQAAHLLLLVICLIQAHLWPLEIYRSAAKRTHTHIPSHTHTYTHTHTHTHTSHKTSQLKRSAGDAGKA